MNQTTIVVLIVGLLFTAAAANLFGQTIDTILLYVIESMP